MTRFVLPLSPARGIPQAPARSAREVDDYVERGGR